MSKNYAHTIDYSDVWKTKTGSIGFKLTNDYLFRALLQRDEKTLKALVASFLRIDPAKIRDIEVTNPIVLGEGIENKEYHLDVKVSVDNTTIDLEMQALRHKGWIERTLVYLCREFTDVNHGVPYSDVKAVWQISFCGFTLFEDNPEFLSEYMFINRKDMGQIYSDKIRITNVNLTRIDLADKDDERYGLTDWARLFKAERWEELIMLAEKNPVVDQAVSSIWYLSEDKKIRDEIWRREDNELIQRSIDEDLAKYEQLKKDMDNMQQKYDKTKQEYDKTKQEYDKTKQEYVKTRQEYDKAKQDNEKLKQESLDKDAEILRLKKELENLKQRD